jgi:hypothetical protein
VKGESLAGLSFSGTTHTNAGSYTDTWTFTDVTGNYTSTSGTIHDIIAYAITGFLQPISPKMATQLLYGPGRTIPIKFQLSGGVPLSDTSPIQSLTASSGSTTYNLFPGATQVNGQGLRYDPSADQYICNWNTPKSITGTWIVTLVLKLARVQDAAVGINRVVAPYGVTVYQVDAASAGSANVTLEAGVTSAAGGLVDGVLGRTTDWGQITLIQGWNWHTGADAGQIAAGQYDFQTILTHELGHALGLGHSAAATSVMYATLSSGVTSRALATADLNLAETAAGPSALHAVPVQAIAAYLALMPKSGSAFSVLPVASPTAIRLARESLDPPGTPTKAAALADAGVLTSGRGAILW